jgi:hypothetical protein
MEDCEGVMPKRVEYDNANTVSRELVCPVRGGGLLLSPTPNRLLTDTERRKFDAQRA